MTSNLTIESLSGEELVDFGQARVRDTAFNAVRRLWDRRVTEGMKQSDLAERLGKDPGWVSRTMRGPGNWTFRTFGALVQALDGESEIDVIAREERIAPKENHQAYDDFRSGRGSTSPTPFVGSPSGTNPQTANASGNFRVGRS